jgi:hypothetical protein
MRRGLFGLLALGVLVAGCQKGTYLKLVFKGDGLAPIHHIQVQLKLADGRVSTGLLPATPAAANVVKMPASAVFILDDYSGALGIDAAAFDGTNALLATDHVDTKIAHSTSWTVELNFVSGVAAVDGGAGDASPVMDATAIMDATAVELGLPDLGGSLDGPLFKLTDGSFAEAGSGCATVTVQAQESVSLDYNPSGSTMDAGNALWAYATDQDHFIGWAKFGLRFIPQKTFTVTKATLNLTLVQANNPVPELQTRYSKVDGWTRTSATSEVSADDIMSDPIPGKPTAGVNAYPLDVTKHDWDTDLNDGTITLGIENVTAMATSRVEFAGVNKGVAMDGTRPTLDLELCR